jgi:hypothetical protein
MVSRFLATALGAALLLSLGAPAASAEICWIDDVLKAADGNGVVIVFKGARGVTLTKPDGAAANVPLVDGDLLPAGLGDRLFLSNNPEDSCGIEVVKIDGRIGVKAAAAFHPPLSLPGAPYDPPDGGVTEQFIPAH